MVKHSINGKYEETSAEKQPYEKLIGLLLYFSNTVRTDNIYATKFLSRFTGKLQYYFENQQNKYLHTSRTIYYITEKQTQFLVAKNSVEVEIFTL